MGTLGSLKKLAALHYLYTYLVLRHYAYVYRVSSCSQSSKHTREDKVKDKHSHPGWIFPGCQVSSN